MNLRVGEAWQGFERGKGGEKYFNYISNKIMFKKFEAGIWLSYYSTCHVR